MTCARVPSRPLVRCLRACLLAFLCLQLVGNAAAQEGPAGLRFTHLSVDAPLVDVLIDGRAVLQDVAIGDLTDYVLLSAGRHEVAVFPHRLPQRSGDVADAVDGPRFLEPIVTFVTLASGEYYTAVLAGFYEPPAEEGELGHLSVAVRPEGTMLSVSGPRGYAAEFTGDQFLTGIQPGTYTIRAQREGHLSATYEVEVRARNTTTVSITLQEDGEGLERAEEVIQQLGQADGWRTLEVHQVRDAFEGVAEPGTARVRIVHAAPTSPPMRVIATPMSRGEEQVPRTPVQVASAGYPDASPYVTIPAGAYAVSYLVQGTGRVALEVAGVEFVAGAVYTLFLSSDATGTRLLVLTSVDAMIGLRALGP